MSVFMMFAFISNEIKRRGAEEYDTDAYTFTSITHDFVVEVSQLLLGDLAPTLFLLLLFVLAVLVE